MSLILSFERITAADRPRVGGKAYALSLMAKTGAAVPSGICITIDAYRQYVRLSGIAERIRMELSRKRFADMRWEEVWDAALRIRNLFLTTPLSERLRREISGPLAQRFGDAAVVVRSSAPDEDSARASFAGLHGMRGSQLWLLQSRPLRSPPGSPCTPSAPGCRRSRSQARSAGDSSAVARRGRGWPGTAGRRR